MIKNNIADSLYGKGSEHS